MVITQIKPLTTDGLVALIAALGNSDVVIGVDGGGQDNLLGAAVLIGDARSSD